jgi:hypothetical protein
MGFEVTYSYKEATGEPGRYSEDVKTKTVKIGGVTEEVGLGALAAKIMTQLARRNILIVDIEIHEYAKKKVSYRETDTGIVIKNKKFSFDSGKVVETDELGDEVSSEEEFRPLPSPSKDLADRSCPLSAKGPTRRAIRHETYDPEPISEFKARQKGLKFTKGKKYPIYSESSMGSTVVYKTTDDAGRDVDISSEYFVAVGSGLIQQEEGPTYVGAENQREEINLWARHEISTDMPDIRRR